MGLGGQSMVNKGSQSEIGWKIIRCLDLHNLIGLGKEFAFYMTYHMKPLNMFKQEKDFCFKNLPWLL